MENIGKEYLDNSFIVIGHSGYGKSTICKAITGNQNIIISSSHKGCTSKVSYNPGKFKGCFGNTYFTMIDTPGLDDSEGRDKEFLEELRNMLQKEDLKIKKIFIVFNFTMERFGISEKTIIKKIIDLIPIKDLWKYISIVVTHYFYSKPEKLKKKRQEFIKDLENVFYQDFFSYGLEKYGISGKFEDMNIVFVDFDDENPTLKEGKDIQKIIENSLNKEPLFKKCKEIIENDVSVIQFEDFTMNKAILYKCTIQKYIYYGQNGKILNEIRVIKSKEKLRIIERSEINPKNASRVSLGGSVCGLICLGGLAFPPLEIVATVGCLGSMAVSVISYIVAWGQLGVKIYKNWDFKNEKIDSFIDESK